MHTIDSFHVVLTHLELNSTAKCEGSDPQNLQKMLYKLRQNSISYIDELQDEVDELKSTSNILKQILSKFGIFPLNDMQPLQETYNIGS